MSKIAEKKALEEFPIDIVPDEDTLGFTESDRNEIPRLGYTKGYDQAMQDFLENACEWLKENSESYVIFDEVGYRFYAYNLLIKDFKNYMQNEEK